MMTFPMAGDGSMEGMSDEEAVYEIFLRQLHDDNMVADGDGDDDVADVTAAAAGGLGASLGERYTEENSVTCLELGMPVEMLFDKRVTFGNYVGRKPKAGSRALMIRLASGAIVDIDAGQLISVWDVLADEVVPQTVQDWAETVTNALRILGNMSPRKSDLGDFFTKVSNLRSKALSIDSLDLAVYIFQERSFKFWMNPYLEAADAGARVPSAAQRYASALLLQHDDVHFKRKPSVVAALESNTDITGTSEEVGVKEGGYKVFDEGQAMFKETEAFVAFYEDVRRGDKDGGSTFRSSCISRLLRGLEVYALSPSSLKPPAGIRHLLKRLQLPEEPLGAATVLGSIGRVAGGVGQGSSSSVTGGSAVGTTEGAAVLRSTPWGETELAAAAALEEDVTIKRKVMAAERMGKVGKKGGSSGRMDYRAGADEHPAICVDNKRAAFYDDAFSVSPETGEVLVHISDVAGMLRRHEVLQHTAKERVSSIFLPSGPLHMLPPLALESLRLSNSMPNEVITAAFEIDPESGLLKRFRVFPSVIGPVFPMDMDTADELLSGVGAGRAGIPETVRRDLGLAQVLLEQVSVAQPWVNAHQTSSGRRSFNVDRRTGTYEMEAVDTTSPVSRMLNSMLTMYSNATCAYCHNVNAEPLPVPLAWENRDRYDSSSVRRFATQPLRNWLSMQQQRQVRAALKMEAPLSRRDCAMAVTHHNSKRRDLSSMQGEGRALMSFETLESHCAAVLASGQGEVVLTAEGLGRGGNVRIRQFGVDGMVRGSLLKGQQVQVRVNKILPACRRVELELI
jgi:hypothetical protein